MKSDASDFDVSEHFGSWVFLSLLTALVTPASYFVVDLVYLPRQMHEAAAVCRFALVGLGAAGLLVRYLHPDWIVRHWFSALLGVYVYHVVFLLWFEYESTDLLRSRYYIGVITITGLTQLFRVQTEVLVIYVLAVVVYGIMFWGEPTLADALFDFATIGVIFIGMAFRVWKNQRRLRREIKHRDDLAALINHGWTFPLRAIADIAKSVRSELPPDAARRIELIEHQARILQAESEAIVESSAAGRLRDTNSGESVAVQPVLELAAASFAVARNGKIDYSRVDLQGIEVGGTEQDLFRVFAVLLSNSISYSPDRRCTISGRKTGSFAELKFTNKLAAKLDPEQVFERYVTFSGGTGIGLYDARAVVERKLGGQLRCRLAGEGEVQFIALLPVSAVD